MEGLDTGDAPQAGLPTQPLASACPVGAVSPGHSSYPHSQLSPGGLSLAIEGPSKAEISCTDNQDGTCSVSYLPVLPGDYSILVKYNEQHIPGSPFTARVTGRGRPGVVTKAAGRGGGLPLGAWTHSD